jgi:thiamine pyrophosphate-dependent acetolactate synthase large subunit-like protein
MPMSQRDALAVVAAHRGDTVVIPTMGGISLWPALSDQPLDFSYMPSSMGQGPALGHGLALARPQLGVVVLCGDGSLLMNLGCLVTIAQYPANLWLLVLDNGLYEITGGQPVAGSGRTDYAGLARSAGWQRVYTFDALADWQAKAADVFGGSGPVFVWLKLEGQGGQKTPTPPRPMADQIQRLRSALGTPE